MLKSIELTLSDFCSASCIKQSTVYFDSDVEPKACILYLHGGGLVYGSRNDLPLLHLQTLTDNGYAIVAFDYPLAPPAALDAILEDVIASINSYIENPLYYVKPALPFYLWGRSAGSYLALLAAASGKLKETPAGILSYYGYGFLTDGWLDVPSPHYRQFPPVSASLTDVLAASPRTVTSLEDGFSLYVYGRQTGTWPGLFYHDPVKYLYQQFSLRNCDSLGCPLFCAHSINDTDIPFSEFLALSQRFTATRFIATETVHDFDRIESGTTTKKLLKATVEFLDSH